MKINFTIPQKSIFTVGVHNVKISGITIGTNLKTGNKFFKCTFSNNEGYLPQWFYITDNSKPFLKKLFTACGIYDEIAEVKDLLNKDLIIHVIRKNLINPLTGEVTKEVSSSVNFESISSLKAA